MWVNLLVGFIAIAFSIGYIVLYVRAKNLITPYKFKDYQFSKINNYSPTPTTIFDEPSLYLTIVAPAYNEEERVCSMLDETLQYLEKRQKEDSKFTFEIIVVNDGSKDKTIDVVQKYIEKKDQGRDVLRLLDLKQNRGKGFAVKQGIIKSRGKFILMADADAATDINDLSKLEKNLKDVAIGSRAHLTKENQVKRNFFRNIISNTSHKLTRYVAGIYVAEDTQCGFKLFKREIAKVLFLNLNSDRWCFDVDVLHIAQKLKYDVKEIGVNWMEKDGSHLTLYGMFTIARDLLLVRLYYIFGFWKINPNPRLADFS
eukprot:gene2081-1953_t